MKYPVAISGQIQIDMERALKNYNILYERKLRQYDNIKEIDTSRIVANEVLAQSYLSIVLKKPSDARARKYKIWSNYHDHIFGGSGVIEPYIISILLYDLTENWLKNSGLSTDSDSLKRTIAKKGAFHIARITSYIWRGDDNWNPEIHNLKNEIEILENNPVSIIVLRINQYNAISFI
jgi:hypothetical protein